MALTGGKRKVITTGSSVANRMGVVPAYAGDAISTIAQVATEKLDFFAKRQAAIEEAKYKAQVEIDTRNTISNFGKQYFDSPKDFTAATDKYIEELIRKAPNRFKDYTKSLASRAAFSEGEKIYEIRQKLDFDKTTMLFQERLRAFNEMSANETYDMPVLSRNITPEGKTVVTNNFDVWKSSNDVPLGEIYKDLKEFYNSTYPEERAMLDKLGLNPEIMLRTQKIGREGLRINNKIKNEINNTLRTIKEEGYNFTVGFDRIRQLELKVTNMLRNEYMKNPVIDEKDGIAVLTGRSKEEAAALVENGIQFLNQELDLAKKEISIYNLNKQNEIKKKHETNINGFIKNPENFVNYTNDQLTADILNLGLKDEEARIYKNSWTAGNILNNFVDYNLSGIGKEGKMPFNAAAEDLFNILENHSEGNLLSVLDVDEIADLKKIMIQQNMKKILNTNEIRDLNLGRIDLFTYNENGELIYDEESGEPKANELWSKITAYAANLNEPIPQITSYFEDVMNLTYTNEMDLAHLDQAAYMAYYFKTRQGFEHQFKSLENKEIIIPLLEYHKLRQLNTSEVPRSTLAEDFFGKLNMDFTKKGQIKTEIDKYIYFGNKDEEKKEGDINITDKINEYIEKYEKRQDDAMGILYTDFATGGILLEELKSRDINKDELRQSIKPIIDVYLTAAFKQPTHVNEKTVEKKLDEVMDFLMQDIQEEGFMWRDNKKFKYTTPYQQFYNWITK